MLTINTLATENMQSPGKVLLVSLFGRLYGLQQKIDDTRPDAVIYQGTDFIRLAPQVQAQQLPQGAQDKIAIGADPQREAVRAAIEQYLKANTVTQADPMHCDLLTDAVMAALSPKDSKPPEA